MSEYPRELVELLVPSIWTRDLEVWESEHKPDPDMPKSKGAKNAGNTIWAYVTDIRRAWDHGWGKGAISFDEARALVLVGGIGLTYVQAARCLGVHKRTVTRRYERAVTRLMDYLNGTDNAEALGNDD